jgi:hypothetical protein
MSNSYFGLLPIDVRRIVERHFWWLDTQGHDCCRGEDIVRVPKKRSLLSKIVDVLTLGQKQAHIEQARRIKMIRCEGVVAPVHFHPYRPLHIHDPLRQYLVTLCKNSYS